MKKYIQMNWFITVILLLSVSMFTQCTDDDDVLIEESFLVDSNGYSTFDQNLLRNALNGIPNNNLSVEEEAGLIFMREEEKLAHDVYDFLYQKWNNPVFFNIAKSEQTHTDAVLLLIEKYNLTDPVGNNDLGVFVNSTLQQLYDDLIVDGIISEINALKVGAAIEEIDIMDLENQLENVVDSQDIERVYENLQKGSRNHLRAFVTDMTRLNVTYIPQFLSLSDYNDIVEDGVERGGQ